MVKDFVEGPWATLAMGDYPYASSYLMHGRPQPPQSSPLACVREYTLTFTVVLESPSQPRQVVAAAMAGARGMQAAGPGVLL